MTEFYPQAGGCSRKLPQEALRSLLRQADLPTSIPSGSELDQIADLGDVHRLDFTDPVHSLVVSSDLLFQISNDGEIFGAVTGMHAMSDIYAGLGQPLFGCATLAADEELLTAGFGGAALSGLSRSMRDMGAVLAGGHTVVASGSFLNVCVTGKAHPWYQPTDPLPGDHILLSKPLGFGLSLAALRVGLVSEDDIRPEYELMRHSNRSAANGLITQLERAPESVRQVTDVSGFGLIGALRTICGPSIVELDSEQLPRTSNASRFIREQAWSALADANLRDSEGFAEYGSGAEGGEVAVLANDPQTSGGLLAIVAADAAVQLTSIADLSFVDIGVIGEIDEEPVVRITPGGGRT